jgi:hypothetical protein
MRIASSPEMRKQVRQLKRLLAEKTMEVDFFKGALQKVEARRQRSSSSGEQTSIPNLRAAFQRTPSAVQVRALGVMGITLLAAFVLPCITRSVRLRPLHHAMDSHMSR